MSLLSEMGSLFTIMYDIHHQATGCDRRCPPRNGILFNYSQNDGIEVASVQVNYVQTTSCRLFVDYLTVYHCVHRNCIANRKLQQYFEGVSLSCSLTDRHLTPWAKSSRCTALPHCRHSLIQSFSHSASQSAEEFRQFRRWQS